jgi:hypothetical protein
VTVPTTDPDREPACPATTATGVPCRAAPLDSGWCFAHDPSLDDVRDEARKRGGRNSSTVARALADLPDPIAEALARLRVALRDVHDGKLTPARAAAVANVARAIVAVYDTHVADVRLTRIEEHLTIADRVPLRPVPNDR